MMLKMKHHLLAVALVRRASLPAVMPTKVTLVATVTTVMAPVAVPEAAVMTVTAAARAVTVTVARTAAMKGRAHLAVTATILSWITSYVIAAVCAELGPRTALTAPCSTVTGGHQQSCHQGVFCGHAQCEGCVGCRREVV